MPFKESTERQGAHPFLQWDPAFRKSTGAPVDHRLFIPLLIATLIAFPARSRADETQWESLRAVAGGHSVAVAVPARTSS